MLPTLFNREAHEDCVVFNASDYLSDKNLHTAASHIPLQLRHPGLLNEEENQLIDYTRLDNLPRFLEQDDSKDLIYQYFPEKKLHQLGLISDLKVGNDFNFTVCC
jgi:hypothetical protein